MGACDGIENGRGRRLGRWRAVLAETGMVAALSASTAGCFRGAEVPKLRCSNSIYCPAGYVCAAGAEGGRCVRPPDGGREAGSAGDARGGSNDAGDANETGRSSERDGDVGDSATPDSADGTIADGSNTETPGDPDGGREVAVIAPDASTVLDTGEPDRPWVEPDAPIGVDGSDVRPDAGRTLGSACSSAAECASSYCVDGVCCDGECRGQCQSCAEPSKTGLCTTVSGTPRGGRPACEGAGSPCAGACSGTQPSACIYPQATVCGAATCVSDLIVQPAPTCTGTGVCVFRPSVTCGSGQHCSGGACVAGIENGQACSGSAQCASGNCTGSLCCPQGQTGCGTACVSLSSDPRNCGSCGRACAAGSSCSGGTCYLTDGQVCTAGGQCLSGICSTFYLDSDGDGFGIQVPLSQCGTTVPAGYASNAGDCCDSDAQAHPGQTATFTTTHRCGTYDYNCDGNQTPKSNGPTDCGTPVCQVIENVCTYVQGCTCSGQDPCTTYGTAPCGESYYFSVKFCTDSGGSCHVGGNGAVAGTQACN